jgi:hypothetical protein
MQSIRKVASGGFAAALLLAAALGTAGCDHTPVDLRQGPAPLRMPPPDKQGECDNYEDSLAGGQIFSMYCGYCHNARALAERPFSNYKNVAVHMRVRANLTGEEYAKLVAFLRRWADVPPPHPAVDLPSPKQFFFGQPIPELRPQAPGPKAAPEAPPPPREGGAPPPGAQP